MTSPKNPEILFLGSGDAFGSGGRLQTSFLVRSSKAEFLIDCGSTTLTALNQNNLNPNDIETVVLSHLHGDHFGGIPFLVLNWRMGVRRSKPLTIVGPPGVERRVHELMEAMFPGMTAAKTPFAINYREIEEGSVYDLGGFSVAPFRVKHPSGAPSHALRFDLDGKILAYTGDTEWTDALIEAGHDADLLIAECYMWEKNVPFHMSHELWKTHAPKIGAKRIILTHMTSDMLANLERAEFESASDGLLVEIT